MSNVAPRFVPALPGVSEFAELNVRTYVTVGGKPGVYFFSLDAESALAVARGALAAAPPLLHGAGWRFTGRRGMLTIRAAGSATARPRNWSPTTSRRAPRFTLSQALDHFLTERIACTTSTQRFRAYRLEIHHRRRGRCSGRRKATVPRQLR
jgi:uncharacterized protein YqjF (DUF2071 family)